MQARISLASHSGEMIKVEIETPKKLIHDPEGNFEMNCLVIVVKGCHGEQELKRFQLPEFQRKYCFSLELPPRSEAVCEGLFTVVHYKNRLQVYSNSLDVFMPTYGKQD